QVTLHTKIRSRFCYFVINYFLRDRAKFAGRPRSFNQNHFRAASSSQDTDSCQEIHKGNYALNLSQDRANAPYAKVGIGFTRADESG
ncbi:MAG TPA: hypothetical protein VEF04_00630, partial [Blastocatellia bacterium]|nr:hypothetical protein [Blastocatellia bacterium]